MHVASASSPVPTPAPWPLPVQDFIPALHVKPEVREGDGHRSVFPSDEVPGSVIRHLLALLSVLPAPLALLVPGRQRPSGQGLAEHSQPPPTQVSLHGLHVGLGQVEGPVHGGRLQAGHSLTFNGDIQPGRGKGGVWSQHQAQHRPPPGQPDDEALLVSVNLREKLSPDVTAQGSCEGTKPFRLRLTTVITSLPPS